MTKIYLVILLLAAIPYGGNELKIKAFDNKSEAIAYYESAEGREFEDSIDDCIVIKDKKIISCFAPEEVKENITEIKIYEEQFIPVEGHYTTLKLHQEPLRAYTYHKDDKPKKRFWIF